MMAGEIVGIVAGAHQFDKTQGDRTVAQIVQPIGHFVVIQSAEQHSIEFHCIEAQAQAVIDGSEQFGMVFEAGDGGEAIGAQTVQADIERG